MLFLHSLTNGFFYMVVIVPQSFQPTGDRQKNYSPVSILLRYMGGTVGTQRTGTSVLEQRARIGGSFLERGKCERALKGELEAASQRRQVRDEGNHRSGSFIH